jgi:predicted XRE-type DNA-binding protein
MGTHKWTDIRPDAVAASGGETAVAEARQRTEAYIDAFQLAEERAALGLAQAEVARRMGVTKSRVSQIERGEVSTFDVIARYVRALGGDVQLTATIGGHRVVLGGTGAPG